MKRLGRDSEGNYPGKTFGSNCIQEGQADIVGIIMA
jgi:hypothetical protein